MNAIQNFASHSFSTYASKNIRIDEDQAGLFCKVADQSGCWMTVRCLETKTAVTPVSCSCGKADCKHQAVVASYYGKLYKVETPKVETPAPKKARKPRNGLVRKVRNGGLIKVAKVPAAPIVECNDVKVSVPVINKITDVSKLGNLNVSQGFSILR